MALLGRGEPIKPHLTIPRDWSASVPASPLKPGMTRFGSTAPTPPEFGVGQPIPAFYKIPRDWSSTVAASPQFIKTLHGLMAGTPLQYGVGIPLPVIAVFPRDWSASVPASPLRPTKYGTWDLAATLPTYGQPFTSQLTIPPAPSLAVAILQAVRYGLTSGLLPPEFGYGVPLPSLITVPPLPVVVVLSSVRYGFTAPTPPEYRYGQPIAPAISIPGTPQPVVVVVLPGRRYGATTTLVPPEYAFGQPFEPQIPTIIPPVVILFVPDITYPTAFLLDPSSLHFSLDPSTLTIDITPSVLTFTPDPSGLWLPLTDSNENLS